MTPSASFAAWPAANDAGPSRIAVRSEPQARSSAPSSAPAADASRRIRAALDRVLASATFRSSARHRAFLAYVVRAVLDDHPQLLRQTVIGIDVFSPSIDDFDPKRNSIVRVEAGRLRRKLARYYAGDGARDDLVIELPVGGYVPRFRERTVEAAATAMPTAPLCRVAIEAVAACPQEPRVAAFAAALVDRVVDALAACDDVRVRLVAGTAAETRRPRHGSDATCVLAGSVACDGAATRVILHLSNAADAWRLWSQRFDFDATADGGLLAFHDRIAGAVTDAVRGRVVALAGSR